jgi:hypothetical protein
MSAAEPAIDGEYGGGEARRMKRRSLLHAGLGFALAGASGAVAGDAAASAAGATTAGASGAAGSAAATRARAVAERLTGPALLDALVRMRGRTDGGLVYGWLQGTRSTVIDGDVQPLCGVVAGAVQRFRRIAPDRYEATILEVAHYTHPETGEPLERVRMPGTGREVVVPKYRFGPVKARFAVALDEWEEFEPPRTGNAAQFAPKSSVHLVRSIGPASASGDTVHVRAGEYGRVYPDRARPPTVWYREWMTWHAAADAMADASAVTVPATYSYSALTSWRPWMQMGDVRGHTAENGYGAKAASWDECPPEFLELTRRFHPDVLDDPARALARDP